MNHLKSSHVSEYTSPVSSHMTPSVGDENGNMSESSNASSMQEDLDMVRDENERPMREKTVLILKMRELEAQKVQIEADLSALKRVLAFM